jgi:hypothetical protein
MSLRKRILLGLLLLLLLAGAGGAWFGRTALQARYCVYRLGGASEAERKTWVERVSALGEPAVPGLIDCLSRAEAPVCANARAALTRLGQHWGTNDPRTAALLAQLAEAFPRLSPAGQGAALELETQGLSAAGDHVGRLLALGGRSPDREVRRRTLALAAAWLGRPEHAAHVDACRELVRTSLQDEDVALRIEAARLSMLDEIGLGRQVAPLLDDPAAEVRRAAMAAVGRSDEAVATDDLLRSLHDSDADVRRLCEAALRSRGLVRSEDLQLARLISDPKPGVRLRVLECLSRVNDLEPGIWLRRLSQDQSPAVRAAAVRAAAELEEVDFSARLDTMARQDPSATVRQLAQHYLQQHKSMQENMLNR